MVNKEKGIHAIVIPPKFVEQILKKSHDALGHESEKKVFNRAATRFIWPRMRADITRYCESCPDCQESKGLQRKRITALKPIVSTRPHEILEIDYLKLSKANTGETGVLMMIDHFTKYCVAVAVHDMDAKAAVNAVWVHWVARFGCPEMLQSDQGSQFESKLFEQLMLLMECKKTHSTPYHPQTNGLVERQNRTILKILKVITNREQKNWPEFIPSALMAYNTSVHTSTGATPYKMMHGDEMRTPLALMFQNFHAPNWTSYNKFIQDKVLSLATCHEICRGNLDLAQKRACKNHDKRVSGHGRLRIGQFAMVFFDRVQHKTHVKKLERCWAGPYEVLDVRKGGSYYVIKTLTKRITAHFERVRPYQARFCDYFANAEGELEYLLDSASEKLTIILPYMTEPVPEDNCSNAADDEELWEPEFDRKYNLRLREEKRRDYNENYIGSDKTTVTTVEDDELDLPATMLTAGAPTPDALTSVALTPPANMRTAATPNSVTQTSVALTPEEHVEPKSQTVTFNLDDIVIHPSEDDESVQTAETVEPPPEIDSDDDRQTLREKNQRYFDLAFKARARIGIDPKHKEYEQLLRKEHEKALTDRMNAHGEWLVKLRDDALRNRVQIPLVDFLAVNNPITGGPVRDYEGEIAEKRSKKRRLDKPIGPRLRKDVSADRRNRMDIDRAIAAELEARGTRSRSNSPRTAPDIHTTPETNAPSIPDTIIVTSPNLAIPGQIQQHTQRSACAPTSVPINADVEIVIETEGGVNDNSHPPINLDRLEEQVSSNATTAPETNRATPSPSPGTSAAEHSQTQGQILNIIPTNGFQSGPIIRILNEHDQTVVEAANITDILNDTVPMACPNTPHFTQRQDSRDEVTFQFRENQISKIHAMRVVEITSGNILADRNNILITAPANLDLQWGLQRKMAQSFGNGEEDFRKAIFDQGVRVGGAAVLGNEYTLDGRYIFVIIDRTKWHSDPTPGAYVQGLYQVRCWMYALRLRRLATIRAPINDENYSLNTTIDTLRRVFNNTGISVTLYRSQKSYTQAKVDVILNSTSF
jgi:transposase InsO family protein